MDDCSDDEALSLNLLEDQAVADIVVAVVFAAAAADTVDVDIVVNVDVAAVVDYFFGVCFFAVNMDDVVAAAAVAYQHILAAHLVAYIDYHLYCCSAMELVVVADVDCLIHTFLEAAAAAAVEDNSFDLPDLAAAAAAALSAYSAVHPLSQPTVNPHHLCSLRSHLDT